MYNNSNIQGESFGWKLATWILFIVLLFFVLGASETKETPIPKQVHDTIWTVDSIMVHDTVIRWYEKQPEQPEESSNIESEPIEF